MCLNKCIYHLHLGPFSPYTALTIGTISRGGVKINVYHHVTWYNLIFSVLMRLLFRKRIWPSPFRPKVTSPLEKWFPSAYTGAWNTDEMQHFERRETLVDFAHESLHEDDFRETDGQTSKVAWKRIHVVEVVQLHRARKVQRHVPATPPKKFRLTS